MTPAWFKPPPQVKPNLATKKTNSIARKEKRYLWLSLNTIKKE